MTNNEHLDLAALQELKAVMGDEFSLLVETFENDSVLRIDAMTVAVNSGEPEAIRRAAHNFKGSASNMAAPALAELCRAMEELGRNGRSDGSEQLLQQVIQEFAKVKQALGSL